MKDGEERCRDERGEIKRHENGKERSTSEIIGEKERRSDRQPVDIIRSGNWTWTTGDWLRLEIGKLMRIE
jgi:hypothetical protein